MRRRIISVLVVLIAVVLLGKACIRRDTVELEKPKLRPKADVISNNYKQPSNFSSNGVDYLMSENPVGNFGGVIVLSTIGEGPKTFNPFNTKDNISSMMSEIMYDGLVTTQPITGEVVPKLAKSFEVYGSRYVVHLRKGIKWSDGKLITADDVVFTWKDIILAGFGNTSIRDSIIINGELPKVYKIDDYTVEFVTPQPFAPFFFILASPIAPKHVFLPAVKRVRHILILFNLQI